MLRTLAQQFHKSVYPLFDSTFFERKQASQYHFKRNERTVKTVKATTLTDLESLAVLDVHFCIERKPDKHAGP